MLALYLRQVFQHNNVLKLMVSVEVIQDFLGKSCLAHMILTFNVNQWSDIGAVTKCPDREVKLGFATHVHRAWSNHTLELTSQAGCVDDLTW